MARLARVVIPGIPHHVTQRGNGGARTFFGDAGYAGHFWHGRFGAVAMDEDHLAAALRNVSLNPVRARLVARAQDWRWSSTRAHLFGKDDGLTARAPIRARFPHFVDLLATEADAETAIAFARLRAAQTIGRPGGR
jgi:putative transposase